MKCKQLYCSKCGEHKVHSYFGSEGDFAGFGPARVILAVGSIGLSETFCRSYYWKCSKCGEVRKG